MIGIRDLLRYAAPGTPDGLSALLVSRVTATCAGLAQFLLVVRPTNLSWSGMTSNCQQRVLIPRVQPLTLNPFLITRSPGNTVTVHIHK
ncbi:hypothetical protein CGCSCA4_v011472 [Colletotrichum siamense]|uniref:Uncharacterized protein n=1 Tax=Colletotrichum siamense TaxID=690259 RepID=A0A9P5K0C7_COLSI|nr:hypothetical protein CGCSCA4_v011472 [Colletotrichum siamense]KAF4852350.1 hypothetical protein CGCSCA2_v010525 [Colletotrichum siamense]